MTTTVVTFAAVKPGTIVVHPHGDKLTISAKTESRIFLTRVGHHDPHDTSFYASEFDAVGFVTA